MTAPLRAIVAGLLLGGGVFALDRAALALIRPPRRRIRRSVDDLPGSVRAHLFTSLGQTLQGWFVEPPEDRGGSVAILVHGWGSSHSRMTLLARPLLEAGHPVFLFDVRHHGLAPPAPYVTARHFRDDIRAAAEEVAGAYPDRPRVLIGHSMGGSCGVLAVAEGAPVDGFVSVAAPADLWGVWAAHFDARGLPGRLIVKVLNPFWRYRAGVPFRTLDPRGRAPEMNVPFLLLHGDQDRSVDVAHARELARAAGVEPVILEGEGHSELVGRAVMVEKVLAFMEGLEGDGGDAD